MFDVLSFVSRGLTQASWATWIVYFLVVTQLTIFTVTLYLHRSQTHRSVDFHPLVAHLFRFWSWLSTGMVTREWVAIHRKHHAKVETAEDPHSPQIHGLRKVLLEGVDLYREARTSVDGSHYGIGTPDDWIERKLYAPHPTLGPALMLVINFMLFGMVGIAIWALQMIWIPFWAAGVINGLGHWWGYRNFHTTDTSTNLVPWGLIVGGEELHNNHHAFPSSAKFSLRRFEIDIGWWAISAMQKLRLAKVLRVAPTLDVRPNVSLPDADTIRALLTHRFQAMSDYYRSVIRPQLKEDARNAGDNIRRLPRKLRHGLVDGGRWLDEDASRKLQAFVARRPNLEVVVEFRARLANVLERNARCADTLREQLAQWCLDAEQTGIESLQQFARRMTGYRSVPARA